MADLREPFSKFVRAYLVFNNLTNKQGQPSLCRINATILDSLFDEFHEKANNWEKQQRAKKRAPRLPKEVENIPPSEEEVRGYCKEKGYNFDITGFFGHYVSNGWKVGPNAVVSWKGCCSTFQVKSGRPISRHVKPSDDRSELHLEPIDWKQRLAGHEELHVHVGRDWDTLLPYYRNLITKACQ